MPLTKKNPCPFFSKILFFLIVFPFYLQSQTYESEKAFRDQQDSIFSILFSDPALAKEKIDNLLAQEDQMSDTTKGLSYSLNGLYFNITGDNDTSLKNYKKAVILLKEHPFRLTKVRMNIGTALRNDNQYEASIKEFEKLLDYYKKENDSLNYAKVLGEIAANYNYTLNHKKAVQYLTKAMGIFERNNFESQRDFGVLIQRLANTYYKQSKFDFADELYAKCLKIFKTTGHLQNYYLTLINLAESLYHQDKNDSALIVINESIEGLEQFQNKNLIAISNSVKGNILTELGDEKKAAQFYAAAYNDALESGSERLVQIARDYLTALVKLKNFDLAQEIYDETEPLLQHSNLEYQYSFILQSASLFNSINDHEKAFELLLRSHELKDSSYQNNNQALVDELQTRYEVEEKERSNAALKLDVLNKEKNISILTLSIIIAIIVLIFITVIWRSRINFKNKSLAVERGSNKDLTKKLAIEQENLELKEKLIEHQKSELLGYSMEVSNMNEKIEALIQKFEESDVSASLSSQLKSLITVNKNWDSFIQRFKEVDPDFIPKLSKAHPKLTQKDLEFCSLVRINISYKDISNFLQISHESVFKKKYRISKKMNLDSEIDFQKYIIQL